MSEFMAPSVGSYSIIRSSRSKRGMIYWNRPEFDSSCGRWFESCGCHFASWRDEEALMDADEMDMAYFHDANPKISCRESIYTIEFAKDSELIEEMWIILIDYVKGKCCKCSFRLKQIPKEKAKAADEAIWHWHRTGEVDATVFGSEPDWRN